MKKIKTAGIVFFLGGLVLLLVSLFADYIGVGDVDPDHFVIGSKQITGMVMGVAAIFIAAFFWLRK